MQLDMLTTKAPPAIAAADPIADQGEGARASSPPATSPGLAMSPGPAMVVTAAPPRCRRCKGRKFVDVVLTHQPHNARSIRRDCAGCGAYVAFVHWYGQPVTPSPAHPLTQRR